MGGIVPKILSQVFVSLQHQTTKVKTNLLLRLDFNEITRSNKRDDAGACEQPTPINFPCSRVPLSFARCHLVPVMYQIL